MQVTTFLRTACAVAMIISLAACGGGSSTTTSPQTTDSSGTSSTDTSGGSQGDSPAPTTTDTTNSIDKYLGSFVSTSCAKLSDVVIAATGAAVYEMRTITVESKLATNQAQLRYKHNYFENSDCTGSLGFLETSGAENTLTIDGNATVSQGTADKITLTEGNKLPGVSGATVTINSLTFMNGYLNPTQTKSLFPLSGQDLFTGNPDGVDAQGYPTALEAAASYKKQ